MEDLSSSWPDARGERMELVGSARTGCAVVVEGPTRMVAPALACSRGSGSVAPRVRRSLEIVGLMRGWTTIVSPSTEVASVAVASLPDEGASLTGRDSEAELAGDGLVTGPSKMISASSSFTIDAFLAFFVRLSLGDGVGSSASLFRFRGDWLGSTEGDFPAGDSSAFLNLENDRGVLFATLGLMLTSGVSD